MRKGWASKFKRRGRAGNQHGGKGVLVWGREGVELTMKKGKAGESEEKYIMGWGIARVRIA